MIPSGSPPPMRGKERSDCSETAAFRITPAYAGKSGSLLFSVSVSGDHPRLCGEKASCSSQKQQTIGSPPPMRGKDGAITVVWEYFRITPAYAGKSCNRFCTSGSGWDHPRLCGEKCIFGDTVLCSLGSPPPMRGKADVVLNRIDRIGITPAYAGKRYIFKGLLCGFKDHPRLCGEKCAEPSIVVTIQGSPPPMRGKVVRAIPDILRKRITPAYAGKSGQKEQFR